MLNEHFADVLKYQDAEEGESRQNLKPISYRMFEKTKDAKVYIKEMGLENEIDGTIEVEDDYKITKIVGFGATSVVYKAIHSGKQNKEKIVAIKKIKDIFQNDVYAHRILRELRLIRLLKGHDNVSEKYPTNFSIDCQVEDDHETQGQEQL